MVTPRGTPLDPSNLMNFMVLETLWGYGALDDILTSIMSNSNWEMALARDMTIFGSHFLFHVTENAYSYQWFTTRTPMPFP